MTVRVAVGWLMSVVITTVARVRDWRLVRHLGSAALVDRVRAAGAIRYHVYRNLHDASQALIVAECADGAAAEALSRELGEAVDRLTDPGVADDRVWESTDIDGIG